MVTIIYDIDALYVVYIVYYTPYRWLNKEKGRTEMLMNKLSIVLGACGIHLCIGSVYAWSVLTNPIISITGWQLSQVTFAFSLAILFLGFSAGFLGNKVSEWGPKKSGFIATGCFVTGLLGSALAIWLENIWLLYLFYGCIGGTGLGIGYITPVATLLKWFPKHKGFAGGCAVMSFGFAATLAGPVMQDLVAKYGVIANFIICAIAYGTVMLLSARVLRDPKKPSTDKQILQYSTFNETESIKPNKAIRTVNFWILWIVFFINIACGIALLSIASPMGQEIGMNSVEAAGMVAMIGIINGGGRIFFATISDYIGRGMTYNLFFVIEAYAFFILSDTTNAFLFQSIVLIIISCYGGGFSCMPAYLSDIFGIKWLSAIHGRILTAWGVAGIAGPLMITRCYEYFGGHDIALKIFSGLFILSLIMSVVLIQRNK
jgi:OFA family oxalate/formate antiporter-like MFS transporter